MFESPIKFCPVHPHNTNQSRQQLIMSHQRLYHHEGPGFFPISLLGQGKFGSVTLVNNPDVGQWARKEPFQLFLGRVMTDRLSHVKLTRPAPIADWECTFIYHVQHIPGVIRLKACARHIKEDGRHAHVTYFEHCNLGSLESFCDNRVRPKSQAIPEYWLATLLINMVTTITAVHNAGIVHRDTPERNWLMHYNSAQDIQIKLADFGEAMHKSQDIAHLGWLKLRREDYVGIHSATRKAMTTKDGSDMPGYSFNFEYIVRLLLTLADRIHQEEFTDDQSLDIAVQTWLKRLEDHLATLEPVDWPFGEPISPAQAFSADIHQSPNVEQQFSDDTMPHHYSIATLDDTGKILNVREYDHADCTSSSTNYYSFEEMQTRVAVQEREEAEMVAARAQRAANPPRIMLRFNTKPNSG